MNIAHDPALDPQNNIAHDLALEPQNNIAHDPAKIVVHHPDLDQGSVHGPAQPRPMTQPRNQPNNKARGQVIQTLRQPMLQRMPTWSRQENSWPQVSRQQQLLHQLKQRPMHKQLRLQQMALQMQWQHRSKPLLTPMPMLRPIITPIPWLVHWLYSPNKTKPRQLLQGAWKANWSGQPITYLQGAPTNNHQAQEGCSPNNQGDRPNNQPHCPHKFCSHSCPSLKLWGSHSRVTPWGSATPKISSRTLPFLNLMKPNQHLHLPNLTPINPN